MKKLRLDLDDLSVESFDSGSSETRPGTVEAHAYDTDPRVCQASEDWRCSAGYGCTLPEYTCDLTCGGTGCFEKASYGGPCW